LDPKKNSAYTDWILFFLSGILFIFPPLFFLEFKQDEWVKGFIPIRMVNAELKFCIFILLASIMIGIVWIRVHLAGKLNQASKPVYLFASIFIASILISILTAHNFERAFVSSFIWYFLPILLLFSILQIKWSTVRLTRFTILIVLGGLFSCLVVMDQHYQWTDWSHRLTRTGYGGLIYNQNFAAEYHAPLLPLALALFYYVKSKLTKVLLLSTLLLIFLPALSLSLARGAWVGLIGGCFLTSAVFLVTFFLKKKVLEKHKSILWIASSFILLALTLPLYLVTSDYWKKGAFTNDVIATQEVPSKEANELKSITVEGSARRIVLWKDALQATLSKDFLFGLGTDHYELHFHESAERSDKTTGSTLVRFVHNDFIQILYENGILGLIGFLGLWITVLLKALNKALEHAKNNNPQGLALILGLSASCLTFLIESFFEFPTRSPCAMIVGWTSFGLLLFIAYEKSSESSPTKVKSIGPKLNLFIGASAIVIIPFSCILANNLFWTNIYHFQGRIAGDYGEKEKSLQFHRKAIEYAPWEHHSRKFECFYLLTHKKQFPEALEAINQTLEVHPGCLVTHQNKIAISINEFKDHTMARKAYQEMKKAAPFHPFTMQESKKINFINP
jgi:O-antigen ligase